MSIEIPLHESDAEVIEITFDELPDDVDEVIHILRTEKASLNYWNTLAIEYYRRGRRDAFVKLLEVGRNDAGVQNNNLSSNDQVRFFLQFLLHNTIKNDPTIAFNCLLLFI